MDVRDPYAPREAAFYIPATTERTAERCVTNGTRSCRVAIQTNNVEADERGLVYLADRDRKSTRLNSSHSQISYAVFCLKKKKNDIYDIVSAIIENTSQLDGS